MAAVICQLAMLQAESDLYNGVMLLADGPTRDLLVQTRAETGEMMIVGAIFKPIMETMSRYGIYDVYRGSGREKSMHLISEDDLSFTSFGSPGKIAEFVKSQCGTNGELVGVAIDLSKLRVIDPCVPRKTC